IDIAFFDVERLEDVVVAPNDFLAGEGVRDREDRRGRVDLDVDGATCFFEQILVWMRQQENRLFGMVHEAVGEGGLMLDKQSDAILPGDVIGHYDGEFGPRDHWIETHRDNAPARSRAAHGGAVDHSWESEIVDVVSGTSDFVTAFFARD